MRKDYYPAVIHGFLFTYLLWGFFTQESNFYRNTILLTFIIGYTTLAVVYHLDKNGKL